MIDELPDRGPRPVGDLVDPAIGTRGLGCQEHRLHDVADMHDRDHVVPAADVSKLATPQGPDDPRQVAGSPGP